MLDPRIISEFRRFYMEHEDTEKCWRWMGNINDRGYGTFTVKGKRYLAHRISYLIASNLYTLDLLVLHHPVICHNPACVNPSHLYAGTVADNANDRMLDGTQSNMIGESNGRCKLSDQKVAELRADLQSGMGVRAAGRKYGISHKQVANIRDEEQRK